MRELNEIKSIIKDIENNTYGLSKENKLIILNNLKNELDSLRCGLLSTCDFCHNESIDIDGNYKIYCSYLNMSLESDFYGNNSFLGCPYKELLTNINSLIKKL